MPDSNDRAWSLFDACPTDVLERLRDAIKSEIDLTLDPGNTIDDPHAFALEWARYTGARHILDRVERHIKARSHEAERRSS